jgi:hypothetical protein
MFEIVGLLGLIILVSVFLLHAAGFLQKRESLFYFFNGFGAGLLAHYALSIQNIYFAILESVWCASAFISLGTIYFKKVLVNNKSTQ